LLTSCTIGPGIATLTVVTKRAATRVSVRLVTVATLWLPLALIGISQTTATSISVRLRIGTALWLPTSGSHRLGRRLSRSILPLESSVLLIEVGLPRAPLLAEICRVFVSKLLLVSLLVELWRASVIVEVVGAVARIIQLAAVHVICVEVVPIDVIRVDVVAINVVEIGIVNVRIINISVVIVITINESI
jgi:hypothetical protein